EVAQEVDAVVGDPRRELLLVDGTWVEDLVLDLADHLAEDTVPVLADEVVEIGRAGPVRFVDDPVTLVREALPQQCEAVGVERLDARSRPAVPVAHLRAERLGRVAVEGQDEDTVPGDPLADTLLDAAGERFGLAGAGGRDDADRALGGVDHLLLI